MNEKEIRDTLRGMMIDWDRLPASKLRELARQATSDETANALYREAARREQGGAR